jgi:hypothetical protein
MQEMGVLCIMLGLLFLSLSMKKTVLDEEVDLPKIKPPKVVKPGKSSEPQREDSSFGETAPFAPTEENQTKIETPVNGESSVTNQVSTVMEDINTEK